MPPTRRHQATVSTFGTPISSCPPLSLAFPFTQLATLAKRLGPNRRLLVDNLAGGGYDQIGQALSRSVVSKPAYAALYELLTGHARKECAARSAHDGALGPNMGAAC